jgi:transcriptional regulator with XRE-family HTH domain
VTTGKAAVQLLKAIEHSGLTHYEIARRAGVAQSALSRLAAGTRSVSLETFEAIADALRLSVTLTRKG